MMTILTLDRLVCISNPVKYKARVKISTVKKIIIASWFLSVTVGILYTILEEIRMELLFAMASLNGSYLMLAIVTYSVVAIKIKQSDKRFNRPSESQDGQRFKKHHMVPCLIVVTYVLFYCVPLSVMLILRINNSKIAEINYETFEWVRLLFDIGLITDPLAYIFATKHFRDIILKKFYRKQNQVIQNRRPYEIAIVGGYPNTVVTADGTVTMTSV